MNTAFEIEVPFEKLYDLSMIDTFCRGDKNLTKKMIQVFIKDMPVSVEELKQAYKANDVISLKRTAHRIKPVLSLYSIVKIGKDIEVLVNMGKEEMVTAETEMKINRLDNVISIVTQQMNKYIS
jgi:HPt (histidine-containing phosphotransfer) domain-containing protein